MAIPISCHNKNERPKRGSNKSKGNKREDIHAKNSCWKRNEVSNHRNESTDKSRSIGINEEKIMRHSILFFGNEKIFSKSMNEWFSNKSTDGIVYTCTNNASNSSCKNEEFDIKFSPLRKDTSRNHNEF